MKIVPTMEHKGIWWTWILTNIQLGTRHHWLKWCRTQPLLDHIWPQLLPLTETCLTSKKNNCWSILQNNNPHQQIVSRKKVAAKLKTEIATINRSNRYGCRGGGGWGEGQRNGFPRRPLDSNGYYWKNGFRVSCDHTNKTCTTKKTVHKEEATQNDTMEGFRYNKNHQFGWHLSGKHGGYINLVHDESSYGINCVTNIVPPTSRKFVITYLGTTIHYHTSTTPCFD